MVIRVIILICATIILTNVASAAELSLNDRALLARVLAENRRYTGLLLASRPNRSRELENKLLQLGIQPDYADHSVGYFRLRLPPKMLGKILSLPEVQASALPSKHAYLSDTSNLLPKNVISPSPNKISLRDYITLAERDKQADWREPIGLRSFWEKSPSFDGRGTTIAIIELFPDFMEREFESARALDGRFLPKLAEAAGFFNQRPDDLKNVSIVDFSALAVGKDKIVSFDGRRVKLPFGGNVEFGFAGIPGSVAKLRDTGPRTTNKSQQNSVAVARMAGSQCILVDSNRNDNLRDERCIAVSKSSVQRNWFRGADGEAIGWPFFAIPTQDSRRIVVASPNPHTHTVTATAAASNFLGSKLGGVAPSAQIISLGVGFRTDELIEALLYAAKNAQVDIILTMNGYAKASAHADSFHNIIAGRAADNYNKVIVAPAGNSLRLLNTVIDEASGEGTLTVGQFAGSAVSSLLKGESFPDHVPTYSSGGPTLDGLLKPDVVAPSLVLAPVPEYRNGNAAVNALCPELDLGSFATCAGGTSNASPSAAGAAAVLISAARQSGIRIRASDIVTAIRASAKFIPGEPAYVQGRGSINIPAAFEYLRRLSKSREPKVSLTVEAPIKVKLGGEISRPFVGYGLYEREGWSPGMSGTREVKITRHSGGHQAELYKIRLLGNDKATFSVPKEVLLPLGRQASIPIEVRIGEPGVHSAILRVEDPRTGLIVRDIALTIIAALPLTETNNSVSLSLSRPRDGSLEVFVDVPPGTAALHVSKIPAQNLMMRLAGPTGTSNSPEVDLEKESGSPREIKPISEIGASVYAPAAGVWAVQVYPTVDGIVDAASALKFTVTAVPKAHDASQGNAGKMEKGTELSTLTTVPDSGERAVRLTEGFRYHGRVSLKPGEHPFILPVRMPVDVTAIDGLISTLNGSAGGSTIALLTVLRCSPDRCAAMSTTAGEQQAGFFIPDVTKEDWDKVWNIVIDAKNESGNDVTIDYEIFLTLKEGFDTPSSNMIKLEHSSKIEDIGRCQLEGAGRRTRAIEVIDPDATLSGFRTRFYKAGHPAASKEFAFPLSRVYLEDSDQECGV